MPRPERDPFSSTGVKAAMVIAAFLACACRRTAPATPATAASAGVRRARDSRPVPGQGPAPAAQGAANVQPVTVDKRAAHVVEEAYDERSEVLRGSAVNVIALFAGINGPTGEGTLLVVDGIRKAVYRITAVAGTLTPDGSGFVYGRAHLTYNDQDDDDPSNDDDQREQVAKQLGADKTAVISNEWHDGICCSFVSQPVHVDLGTRKMTFLKTVGGHSLCHDGKHVIGLLKKRGKDVPHWLDLAKQHWIPVESTEQARVLQHLRRCDAATTASGDLPAGTTLASLSNGAYRIGLVESAGVKYVAVDRGAKGADNGPQSRAASRDVRDRGPRFKALFK